MHATILFTVMILSAISLAAPTIAILFHQWRRRGLPGISETNTFVSIVKPIRGAEPHLQENLESFFQLSNHIRYELLMCIKDAHDPAVPLVRAVMARHPHVKAKLYLESRDLGKNPKISNMHVAWEEASSDLILISDSNVRVPPNYLENLLQERKSGVGLVTQAVYGADAHGLGGHLDVSHLNSFYLKATVFLELFGIQCVLGKCMLLSRRNLARLGGLWSVRQYLAEDLVIGEMMKDEGYVIRRMPQLLRQTTVMEGFAAYWKRHVRWARLRKCHVFSAYLLEPLLFESFWPLIVLASAGIHSWMARWAFGSLAFQGVLNLALYTFVFRERSVWRSFIFFPLKDIVAPAVWFAGLISNAVVWRGQKLHLRFGGRLGSRYGKYARLRAFVRSFT